MLGPAGLKIDINTNTTVPEVTVHEGIGGNENTRRYITSILDHSSLFMPRLETLEKLDRQSTMIAKKLVATAYLLLLVGVLHLKAALASKKASKPSNGPLLVEKSSRIPTSNDVPFSEQVGQFESVVYVSAANLVINSLRPDPQIRWHMKIPRMLWEISIMTVAKAASSSDSISLYMMLFFLTGSTAIIDLFVWAPIFAAMTSFETCQGGFFTGERYRCHPDNIKGYGRLLATVQSIVGGMVYLMAAITAWNAVRTHRDQQKIAREIMVLERWEKKRNAAIKD